MAANDEDGGPPESLRLWLFNLVGNCCQSAPPVIPEGTESCGVTLLRTRQPGRHKEERHTNRPCRDSDSKASALEQATLTRTLHAARGLADHKLTIASNSDKQATAGVGSLRSSALHTPPVHLSYTSEIPGLTLEVPPPPPHPPALMFTLHKLSEEMRARELLIAHISAILGLVYTISSSHSRPKSDNVSGSYEA